MTRFNIDLAKPGSLWQFQGDMSRRPLTGVPSLMLYLDEGMAARLANPSSYSLRGSKHFERVQFLDFLLYLPGRQQIGPWAHVKFLHSRSEKVGWLELSDCEKTLVDYRNAYLSRR